MEEGECRNDEELARRSDGEKEKPKEEKCRKESKRGQEKAEQRESSRKERRQKEREGGKERAKEKQKGREKGLKKESAKASSSAREKDRDTEKEREREKERKRKRREVADKEHSTNSKGGRRGSSGGGVGGRHRADKSTPTPSAQRSECRGGRERVEEEEKRRRRQKARERKRVSGEKQRKRSSSPNATVVKSSLEESAHEAQAQAIGCFSVQEERAVREVRRASDEHFSSLSHSCALPPSQSAPDAYSSAHSESSHSPTSRSRRAPPSASPTACARTSSASHARACSRPHSSSRSLSRSKDSDRRSSSTGESAGEETEGPQDRSDGSLVLYASSMSALMPQTGNERRRKRECMGHRRSNSATAADAAVAASGVARETGAEQDGTTLVRTRSRTHSFEAPAFEAALGGAASKRKAEEEENSLREAGIGEDVEARLAQRRWQAQDYHEQQQLQQQQQQRRPQPLQQQQQWRQRQQQPELEQEEQLEQEQAGQQEVQSRVHAHSRHRQEEGEKEEKAGHRRAGRARSPGVVRGSSVRSPDRSSKRERTDVRQMRATSPPAALGNTRRLSRSPQRNGRKRGVEESQGQRKRQPEKVHYKVDTLFRSGFLEYFHRDVVTDLTLLFNGEEYRVHRLIIAHASRHFHRVLKGHSGEVLEVTLPEIEYDSLQDLFKVIIEYMYTGKMQFSPETSLPLLVVADKFQLEHLHKLAVAYISQNIERQNALQMLQQALHFHIKEIQDEATEVVARNFSYIYDADYSDFPPEVMMKILTNDCLNVRAEYALYKKVLRYIKRRKPSVTQEQADAMMSCIRFRWLSLKELHQANKNVLVPRNLLIEALLIKLEDSQAGKAVVTPSGAAHLQPRKNLGLSFEYKSKYKREDLRNCKGILHWLATDHGRQERCNPHTAGDVKVTASSVEKGNPEELVGAQPCELWTKDVPSSWFSLDFRTRRVRVNCYSLRHGGNHRADSLRTWDLQASNDGSNWVLLRRHTSDDTLDGAFCVGSWDVDSCDEAYRYFRILQTGHNSSINNYLVVSGVELYGTLYELAPDAPKRSGTS